MLDDFNCNAIDQKRREGRRFLSFHNRAETLIGSRGNYEIKTKTRIHLYMIILIIYY